ncbi:MAG: hypothetical protein ABI429_00670 [Jatrophihabitantaceae bacterium]
MTNVEFISETPDPLGHSGDVVPVLLNLRVRTFVVALPLMAGGALLIAAPFQPLLGTRMSQQGHTQRFVIDGWGRLPGGADAYGHGPLYGIALYLVAALALGLAAMDLWQRLKRPVRQYKALRLTTSVAAPGTLFGIFSMIVLDYEAVVSSTSAINASVARPTPQQHAFIGSGTWMIVAALALTIAAAVPQLVQYRKDTTATSAPLASSTSSVAVVRQPATHPLDGTGNDVPSSEEELHP